MALTEHKKQIAMKIAEKFGDVTLESVVFNNGDNVDSAWTFEAFVEGLLDSMPKPDPVGAIKELGKRLAARLDEDDWNYIEPFLRECEAPIAQPASAPSEQKPFEIIWPTYHHEAMGCGLEDRSITDRYEAMQHGWDCAIERVSECLPEIIYEAPQPDYKAQRDATQALSDVIAERLRQRSVEGWTPEHDDSHTEGEMAAAAACYALSGAGNLNKDALWELWPRRSWSLMWFKPKTKRADIVRAGALILAEIERIDRAAIASVKCGAL